jgi:hypothetical protein
MRIIKFIIDMFYYFAIMWVAVVYGYILAFLGIFQDSEGGGIDMFDAVAGVVGWLVAMFITRWILRKVRNFFYYLCGIDSVTETGAKNMNKDDF